MNNTTIRCDKCGEEIEIPVADCPEFYLCPECGERFRDDRPIYEGGK